MRLAPGPQIKNTAKEANMRVRVINQNSERAGQQGWADNWNAESFWVAVRFADGICQIARRNLEPMLY